MLFGGTPRKGCVNCDRERKGKHAREGCVEEYSLGLPMRLLVLVRSRLPMRRTTGSKTNCFDA